MRSWGGSVYLQPVRRERGREWKKRMKKKRTQLHKTVLTARENEDQWCCEWSRRCSSQEMKPVFRLFSSTFRPPPPPSGTTTDETAAPAAASTGSNFSETDLRDSFSPSCVHFKKMPLNEFQRRRHPAPLDARRRIHGEGERD